MDDGRPCDERCTYNSIKTKLSNIRTFVALQTSLTYTCGIFILQRRCYTTVAVNRCDHLVIVFGFVITAGIEDRPFVIILSRCSCSKAITNDNYFVPHNLIIICHELVAADIFETFRFLQLFTSLSFYNV